MYRQVAKATQAIDKAFEPLPKETDVLFHRPVTKQWIRQFVLAPTLYGHRSFRAVLEILETLSSAHFALETSSPSVIQLRLDVKIMFPSSNCHLS